MPQSATDWQIFSPHQTRLNETAVEQKKKKNLNVNELNDRGQEESDCARTCPRRTVLGSKDRRDSKTHRKYIVRIITHRGIVAGHFRTYARTPTWPCADSSLRANAPSAERSARASPAAGTPRRPSPRVRATGTPGSVPPSACRSWAPKERPRPPFWSPLRPRLPGCALGPRCSVNVG